MEFAVWPDGQQADGHWEFEAARAAGAGIEVEHSLFVYEVGDMRVAVEHGGEPSGCWIEVERAQVVEHVDIAVGDEDDFGFGEFAARAFAIDIAAYGCDWSDLAQLFEDGDFADVAEVKDAVDTGESGSYFWAEEAVGVADYADAHGALHAGDVTKNATGLDSAASRQEKSKAGSQK
jgi:hypothetical protein